MAVGKSLQNVDKISFIVDTLLVKNGRKLGMIRPDEHGYYTMPMMVLGTPTDNNTYYEVEDFVPQLISPDSFFNTVLTGGGLFGEYGHPLITLLPDDQRLPRLMTIDEKQVSHHIKSVKTGEKLESGGRILYGQVKPSGPYGSFLKESLDDPCINTAFSLRSIAHSRVEGGLTRRRVKHLVTFDYVSAGGYREASKRYAPSVEVIDLPITRRSLTTSMVAIEHRLSNTELNEIFGAKIVTIGSQSTTFLVKEGALKDTTGTLRSVFTRLLGQPL